MNLYVSNLAYSLTDEELLNEFAAYGTVAHARVVKDRETGRSRGFGFVDMPDDNEARAAIDGLNNAAVGGRPLKVVEARPKEERPSRPSGPPGGGGGDRRGGPPPRKNYDDRRGGGGNNRGGGGGGNRGGGDWDRDRDRDRDRGFSRGGRRDFNDFED